VVVVCVLVWGGGGRGTRRQTDSPPPASLIHTANALRPPLPRTSARDQHRHAAVQKSLFTCNSTTAAGSSGAASCSTRLRQVFFGAMFIGLYM
jgi:hypothetical protein